MRSQREQVEMELLVLRCRRNDQDAWRRLIAAWEPRVFYYVRRLVAAESDAWDVLQQVWLAAYQGIASLSDARQLPAWLYQIARNKAISLRRVRLPELIGEVDDTSTAAAEDDAMITMENVEAVHRALDMLSLPHREALTLHFLQDLSIEQIARLLDVPPGTVKSRLHHARRALRLALEREATP